eukprot:gene10087-21022_t
MRRKSLSEKQESVLDDKTKIIKMAMTTTALSTLEKFSPYIIEAYLRGDDWKQSLEDFFRLQSPKFQGFRERREEHSSSNNRQPSRTHHAFFGSGYDPQMQAVHNEFLLTLEEVLESQLKLIDVSVSHFLNATRLGLEDCDAVPDSLLKELNRYSDFFSFGEMMEDRFIALYPDYNNVNNNINNNNDNNINNNNIPGATTGTVTVNGVDAITNSSLDSSTTVTVGITPPHTSTTAATVVNNVRVLWDIENVGVSHHLGGLETVRRLMAFLRGLGLSGEGVDCRISAFFNPAGVAVRKAVVADLDRAAVEMVWVSGKREDADRKLGNRILQEMQVLVPSLATFIVITSDQDFRHHFQLLTGRGYRVIVIHKAANSKWSEALGMHCSQAFHWDEILGNNPSRGTGQKAATNDIDTGDWLEGESQQQQRRMATPVSKYPIPLSIPFYTIISDTNRYYFCLCFRLISSRLALLVLPGGGVT